jgi:hypothetical protein
MRPELNMRLERQRCRNANKSKLACPTKEDANVPEIKADPSDGTNLNLTGDLSEMGDFQKAWQG